MEKIDNKKIYDFLKGNIINFIVIFTAFGYIFYGMVGIERTDLTVWECIAKVGIGIVVGFMIKQGIGENGFNKGYRSQIWIERQEKYFNACNIANPHIEKVDNFYAYEEIEKKKLYRRSNLMSAQMKYSWFFDKNGNYIDVEIISKRKAKRLKKKGIAINGIVLDFHQRKILRKCVRVKIYNLNLFSEYNNEIDNCSRKERTDKDQRAKMLRKNGLKQILTAVVGAYFVATWNNWDWGNFITATIQVAIWCFTGVLQLYSNYNYVVVEKTSKLLRKCELIVKFIKGCENGQYNKNPYDELEEEEENERQKILDTNGDFSSF